MIRRLLETLIIECFENNGIGSRIKDADGNFYFLKELVSKLSSEDSWNPSLSRNTKAALPRLREVGNFSAHSRTFIARKSDIDNLKMDIRIAVEELVRLARLRR
jgi:hypothetical protein